MSSNTAATKPNSKASSAGAAPAGAAADKAIVFAQPAQVSEILREVDRLKLPLLIRYSRTGSAVRALFSGFQHENGVVTLTGISALGSNLLLRSTAVKIEFILLSKKIVFVSQVVGRAPGTLRIKVPEKVIAIERRTNVRFKVPVSQPAFVGFPNRKLQLDELDTPFIPSAIRNENSNTPLFRVDDVSLGGIAGFTRFSGVSQALKGHEEEQPALLYLPGRYPIKAPVTIRWTKKTSMVDTAMKFESFKKLVSNFVGDDCMDDLIIKESYFRIGVQFAEVSKDLDGVLRSFMKAVQQAESV